MSFDIAALVLATFALYLQGIVLQSIDVAPCSSEELSVWGSCLRALQLHVCSPW